MAARLPDPAPRSEDRHQRDAARLSADASARARRGFVINDSTVMDLVSGLAWERTAPSAPKGCSWPAKDAAIGACTRAAAQAYCEQLELAGSNDWRLPTLGELATLVDHVQGAADGFDRSVAAVSDSSSRAGEPGPAFWTSSPTRLHPAYNDGVAFGRVLSMSGMADFHRLDSEAAVRCVHGPVNPEDAAGQENAGDSFRARNVELSWLREPAPVSTLVEAAAFCKSRNHRLPTSTEILSILDFRKGRVLPNGPFDFPIADSWSVAPHLRNSASATNPGAIAVDLVTGTSFPVTRQNLRLPALCVRP